MRLRAGARWRTDVVRAPPWQRVPTRALPYHRPMPRNRPTSSRLPGTATSRSCSSSQAVSSLGDAVSFTALPLLVLALTGSGFAMGVVGALQTLPDLFFGMIAGAIADRSDRKRMMFLADLGRAGLTALIPLSVALDGPTMAVIVLVAAPMAVLPVVLPGRLHRVGPALVGREPDRARELLFRGHLLARLHHRAGHRRPPGGDHRPGPDARDRRGVVRWLSSLALAARPARPAGADRATAGAPAGRHPRRGRLHRRQPDAAQRRSRSGPLTAILLSPLVTALTVDITVDLGYEPSILGLVLAAYGVGTVVGSLLSARWIGRGRVAQVLIGGNADDGPRPDRAGGLRSRSRSCSPSRSWPASPSHWCWSCT